MQRGSRFRFLIMLIAVIGSAATALTLMMRKPGIRWHLDENSARGVSAKADDGEETYRVVKSADISKLDLQVEEVSKLDLGPAANEPSGFKPHPPLALWSKKSSDADLQGYASVVDEQAFTDLRQVRAQDAENLDSDGIEIGRVKLKRYDPLDLAHFLIASGIVDANIHVQATVTGSHFPSDTGHWFRFHSDDPYWTMKKNQASYDFGLHIAPDGTIRMINVRYLGQKRY
jgi:hypothetical protein